MLLDSQGQPLPDSPGTFTADLGPDARQQAMRRIAEAIADLTQRGAKAHRSGMDSVRVPLDHLFVVCQAMYAVLGPQE